jgi:hypothetical protein
LTVPPNAAVIVPPRSSAVPSGTAETAPSQRDRHLEVIAERGRRGWQKASGYNRRALAEATIGRFKRVIGGALRSRTDRRQATEVAMISTRTWRCVPVTSRGDLAHASVHTPPFRDPCG